jgi:hypothetical protein
MHNAFNAKKQQQQQQQQQKTINIPCSLLQPCCAFFGHEVQVFY